MKFKSNVKRLIVLTSLILISLESISQTSDSTTCIPNSQLRTAVKLIERGRLDSAELEVQRRNVMLLNSRVKAKDDIITEYIAKDSTFKQIKANYESERGNMLDQVGLANKRVAALEKDVRRQKRKTFVSGLVGLLATGLTLYLTTK